MGMNANSRASDLPSRSDLGHLVIVLVRRRVRRDFLRWQRRRIAHRTRGVSVYVILIPGGSIVPVVSPLVVGLVRLVVVVGIVAAVRIIRPIAVRVDVLSVIVPAVPLVELVTVLPLFLRRTSMVVPGV